MVSLACSALHLTVVCVYNILGALMVPSREGMTMTVEGGVKYLRGRGR